MQPFTDCRLHSELKEIEFVSTSNWRHNTWQLPAFPLYDTIYRTPYMYIKMPSCQTEGLFRW